jgi:hypothetical protein
MAGFVLVLAGLTCGDRGQSAGAARAPVEMTRRDGFGCYLRVPGRPLVAIELSKGSLSIQWPEEGKGGSVNYSPQASEKVRCPLFHVSKCARFRALSVVL